MSQSWYYARGNEQFGPVTLEQLQGLIGAGDVQHSDMVWMQGMSQWMPAERIATMNSAPERVAAPVAAATVAATTTVATAPPQAGSVFAMHGYAATQATGGGSYFGMRSVYDQNAEYGGFWIRVVAYIIDYVITFIAGMAVGIVIGIVFGVTRQAGPAANQPGVLVAKISGFAITWLYFALMECSPAQATVGKLVLGLKVTDEFGDPIGFGRATGRFFGKLFSGLLLGIGFMQIGWSARKQGLHDLMASTLVVSRTQ